ncbi:hypothetical protein HCA61_22040 [Rhodococcus sp. HNM0563]|nr:hypothetical protein [Rhodococcus sp. HNM0563]
MNSAGGIGKAAGSSIVPPNLTCGFSCGTAAGVGEGMVEVWVAVLLVGGEATGAVVDAQLGVATVDGADGASAVSSGDTETSGPHAAAITVRAARASIRRIAQSNRRWGRSLILTRHSHRGGFYAG